MNGRTQMSNSYTAILLAAGKGTRLGAVHNKVLLPLEEKNPRPLFDYALRVFLEDKHCAHIHFILRPSDESFIKEVLNQLYGEVPEKVTFVYGGKERQDSVKNGLDTVRDEYVFVHDAARPFIDQEMVDALFLKAKKEGAAIVAIPAKDTVKRVRDEAVVETLYRPEVWQVQTPQAFRSTLLKEAYAKATEERYRGNEEGELVERMGQPVSVIQGKTTNFKVTTPEDLELAKGLIKIKREKA